MGDGTRANPYTRKDVLRLIKENGGEAEGLDLSGKIFESDISLSGKNLNGIILRGTDLDGAYFEEADLSKADLSEAYLHDAWFKKAELSEANLSGAYLERAQFGEAWMRETNLQKAQLVDANLEGAYLGDARLNGCNLSHAGLKGIYLHNAEFTYDTKFENANWGDYILKEENTGCLDLAQETYRRLKNWHTQHGIHDVAAEFYYREKEATRKSLRWRSKSTFWHRLASELFRAFFGYGEKWNRILIWMATVVFGLAGAYHLWGSFSSSSFSDTLYYSAVSFTALGYGQWATQPTGWAKGMGVAEAFIGVFMMALLLVTFVRKWTR
jgi:hypothetical protein